MPRGPARRTWLLAAGLSAAGLSPALAQNATIDMSRWDLNHDLTRVDNVGDGDTIAVTVAGLEARRNENPADDHYMYFDVADGFIFQATPPELYVTFHYYDAPGLVLWLQYDSTTEVYETAPGLATAGTNVWKAHTVVLRDAYFGNRQKGGADFRIAAPVGAAFYVDLVYVRVPAPHMPAVRITPAQHRDLKPEPWRDICSRWSEWGTARSRTEMLGSADHVLNAVGAEELRTCFSRINQSGLALSLEVPVLKETADCPGGQACYDAHAGLWDGFGALGANIRSLYMDEPYHAARIHRAQLQYSDNDAINQVLIWMRLVRAAYPHVQLLEVEPHPAIPVADLNWWQRALHAACAATGIPVVDFFVLDHDWRAPGWTFSGVRQIQAQSKALGIPFGVLFWASDRKTSTWDADWAAGLMQQGRMYRRAGIVPDLYDVNDFIVIPRATVPDSLTSTYTESVVRFTNRFVRRRY